MFKRIVMVCTLALCVGIHGPLSAEESESGIPGLGFSFFTGYPIIGGEFMVGGYDTLMRMMGIGAVITPTTTLTVEPGFFFMNRKRDYQNNLSGSGTDTDDYLYAGGSLGVFHHFNAGENMFIYLGPRVDAGRYEYDEDNADGSKGTTKQFDVGFSLVLGFKYMLTKRLCIYGDMGLGYFMSNKDYDYWNASGVKTSDNNNKYSTFALSRGNIGFIFFVL
jgi:hypothetical protein